MVRTALFVLFLFLCGSAAAASGCVEAASPGDVRNVRCTIEPTGADQHFVFKANFTGGHDDTKASLKARRGDEPLECAPGSKTSLFGEDGEVSLTCKVRAKGEPGKPVVVDLVVLWSHAQYENHEWFAE